MDLGVVAISFGVVAVAELPDKTMIATIVMASRSRPLPVWVGGATAMVVNAAVAVGAGRLLALLPHRVVESVVAALFLAGALYLILRHESGEERRGERDATRINHTRHVVLSTFGVILVAELGDLTQILTANLAARYHQPWSVFVGAATALVAVMGLGVLLGRALLRVVPLGLVRKIAGALLGALALYSAVQTARR